jgi:hypothetical protein
MGRSCWSTSGQIVSNLEVAQFPVMVVKRVIVNLARLGCAGQFLNRHEPPLSRPARYGVSRFVVSGRWICRAEPIAICAPAMLTEHLGYRAVSLGS